MTDVRSGVRLANYPQSNETARNETAAAWREEKGSGAKTHFATPARFAQAPGPSRQGRTGARDLARSVRCLESAQPAVLPDHEDCFAGARDRFGLRVIEFSVLGN